MIESDEKNSDSSLYVEFYSRPVKNEFESTQQGRPIFIDVDYVKIMLPGDSTSQIDTPANDDHKRRFPLHWAHYKNVHGDDKKEIGTPLTQWPFLSPAQCEELKALKFRTVESIAHASDAQIAKVGMAGGIGPHQFRERAQRYLRAAMGDAENNKQAEELAKLKARDEERDAELESLREQMKELLNAHKPKAEPGRKPKVKEDANNHASVGAAGD